LNENTGVFPRTGETFLLVIGTLLLSMALELLLGGSLHKVELLIFESLILLPVLVFVFFRHIPFQRVFRLYPVRARLLLYAALMGTGFSVVSEYMGRFIERIFPMPDQITRALADLMTIRSFADGAILILGAVGVAGIAEEMLFRGFLQNSLEHRMPAARAIAIGALLFALMHFNPWWFPDVLMMGVLLGLLAWRSGSIVPCIVIHVLYNGISLWALNTDRAIFPMDVHSHGQVILPVAAVLLIAAAGTAFWQSTKPETKIRDETGEGKDGSS